MQFKEKLISHTWENGEKPNFGPHFDPFGPNLGPPIFSVTFTAISSQILFQAIIICNLKEN